MPMQSAKSPLTPETLFADLLLQWYRAYGRHHLPWQEQDSWYTRLVSEIMLQQTQVQTVIPYFYRFLEKFPTPERFASSSEEDVMKAWEGLGYYSRARHLHKAVQMVVFERNGQYPQTAQDWETLPGVGPSTAGALAAFISQERSVMCDGNAKRSLSRIFAIEGFPGQRSFETQVWSKAREILPEASDMPDYTQALMDLGATICKRHPVCDACPMREICRAKALEQVEKYPGKKPIKSRPIRYTHAFFAFQGERFYLVKRAGSGVWHNLWVPFLSPFSDQPNSSVTLPISSDKILLQWMLPEFTHDFSHYRLILYPVIAELSSEVSVPSDWKAYQASLDALPAMPAPIVTLLKQIIPLRALHQGQLAFS